jgi:hypothetical protein
LIVLLSALIVAAAIWWATLQIVVELRASRDEAVRARTLAVVQLLTPAVGAGHADPRALLAWQPIARVARQLFPSEYAAIDSAAGGAFPFNADQAQAAHAQWTADWLAWERTHDSEYKLKAAAAEQDLDASGGSALLRAKLDAIESEKLDLYQRRYAEYVRVAKALQALTAPTRP